MKFSAAIALPLLFCCCPALAADRDTCSRTFVPAPGSYRFVESDTGEPRVPPGATIDTIHVTRLEVFDESNPRENNAIYRFGNRFHILTRERTVMRDILFREGDAYNDGLIEESARLLRARDHLYDADIRPVSVCGDSVDVEVITRDVWSFTPEASVNRSGGENSFRFGVAETNLLGLGRELSFVTEDDIDRRSTRFGYEDANIGGSRINLKLEYTDSDDGFQQYGTVGLPFYSLDARQSWNVTYDKVKRDVEQFFRGEEVSAVREEIEEGIVSFGFSRGLVDGVTRRWRLGWTHRTEAYLPSPTLPSPTRFPGDRKLSYPWVEFHSLEDNYTTSFNLDEIHRTEDLHIGHSFRARLGLAAEGFGSSEDRIITRIDFSDTLLFNDRNILQHFASASARYNVAQGDAEDVLTSYTLRYFRSRNSHRSFFATFSAVYSHNINAGRQVALGGLTGARAFDNRFQLGDRRIQLSLEERKYTDLHILNLIRVGYAAFLDVGRAWDPGTDDGIEQDLLANVGIGLRLASSKADVGRVVHIDGAFPLTNRSDPDVDSFQISINIKSSF